MKTCDLTYVKNALPKIRKDASKYQRGHMLLIAGSFGMAGACMMAAKAALKTGVGYLSILIPKSIYPIVASNIYEGVFIPYDEENLLDIRKKVASLISRVDSVVLGPGLGELREKICPVILEKLSADTKILIDADGLNYLSMHPEMLKKCKGIITPHEGEAGRLLNISRSEVSKDREKAVNALHKKYEMVSLLKGKGTLIKGDDLFMNETGNEGMARAGSGDVLSGIIGAFLAIGMNPLDAAVCGAYVHGLAGDIAREKHGVYSMLPTDLIDEIETVLKKVEE